MPPNESQENIQIVLSKDEVEELLHETITKTLLAVGLDAKKPIELQRDFSYLRNLRESSKSVKTMGLTALIVMFVTGTGTALVLGLKELLVKGA